MIFLTVGGLGAITPNEILAEREGFEPSIRCRIHTFQACAFDRSAISPKWAKVYFERHKNQGFTTQASDYYQQAL